MTSEQGQEHPEGSKPQPGPSRKRLLAPRPVIVVALVTAICLLGDSALYVLLPANLEVFAVTPTGAGLILGVNRYVRILSNSGAGWLYERVGFQGPFIGAVLLAALTTASYGLFVGFWPLFIAHALWGVSWSFLRLGGYLAVIDAAQGASVGRLMGVLQGMSRSGSLLAVLIGGVLADTIGGREAFVIFGVLTFTAFFLVPFTGVSKDLGRRQPTPAPSAANPEAPDASVPRSGHTLRIRMLYAQAAIAWLVIPGLFVSTAGYTVRTVAGEGALFLGALIGVGTLSGALVAVRWAGDLGLGPVFGHLSDRLGRSRVILASLGIAAAAMLVVALNQALPAVLLTFSVIFLVSTALLVSLNASVAELAPPERRATILGRYTTWADIGSGTGPIAGLPLVTGFGFGWSYGGGAAIMVLAAAAYWWVFSRERG